MTPQPTPASISSVLEYRPETGVFIWIAKAAKNTKVGSIAGRIARAGYVEIGLGGRLYKAHRLAWVLLYGHIDENRVIDHINGKKCDNRISNLRLVTPVENGQNRHRPAGRNTAVGVTWDKARKKWRADIKIGRRCVTLGRFDHHSEAVSAHAAAKAKHHRIWPELIEADGAPAVPTPTPEPAKAAA